MKLARFWTVDAWKQSGGLNPKQLPSKRFNPPFDTSNRVEKWYVNVRLKLRHDEKEVHFRELFGKKGYYFGAMHKTGTSEEQGLEKW